MAYKRVNWENLPSTKTPVNANNLNKMDKELGLTDKSLKYNGEVPTDWNDAKTFGVYRVSGSGYSNAIHGGGLYGILIVYESLGGTWTPVADGGSWIWQEFRDTEGNIYKRYAVNDANTWSPWDDTVKNSTKWNNMENDLNTTNDSDTWIPVLREDKLQHTTINSIVSRGIKSCIKTKTINNASFNDYGNVDLGLTASSAMVLGVIFANPAFNSIPFINQNRWYCYIVKNQAQTTLNLQTNGTVSATVYYIEI